VKSKFGYFKSTSLAIGVGFTMLAGNARDAGVPPRQPSLIIHTRDSVADPQPFSVSKCQPEPQLYFTLRIGRRKACMFIDA
jgi:hypothetical protein